MKQGTLYGIGVGPGDPELITVKGARLLANCRHIFVPKARTKADSLAYAIARGYLDSAAVVHELLFPMTPEREELARRWGEAAGEVVAVLEQGEDACFLTLGDPLLYSTYIYLLREVQARLSGVDIVTVPGVAAFSAAAALTGFPVGEAKEPVRIIPTADDLQAVRLALRERGTVVLMKIGRRLPAILKLLEEAGLTEDSVLVSHAGLAEQRVVTDLRSLRGAEGDAGYLSVILCRPGGRETT